MVEIHGNKREFKYQIAPNEFHKIDRIKWDKSTDSNRECKATIPGDGSGFLNLAYLRAYSWKLLFNLCEKELDPPGQGVQHLYEIEVDVYGRLESNLRKLGSFKGHIYYELRTIGVSEGEVRDDGKHIADKEYSMILPKMIFNEGEWTKNKEIPAPKIEESNEKQEEPQPKNSQFRHRAIHLEYEINADARVIYNYLQQNYVGIHIEITDTIHNNVRYYVDQIGSFDPDRDDVPQFGFLARGKKISPKEPVIEPLAEMFFITINQGQPNISILSFDADNTPYHLFTTQLYQELSKAFKIRLKY